MDQDQVDYQALMECLAELPASKLRKLLNPKMPKPVRDAARAVLSGGVDLPWALVFNQQETPEGVITYTASVEFGVAGSVMVFSGTEDEAFAYVDKFSTLNGIGPNDQPKKIDIVALT